MEFRNKEITPSQDLQTEKKGFDFDKMWLGTVLGMIAPMLTMIGYYYYNFSHISVDKFIDHLFAAHIESKLLSLCVVSNLLVFFIFIWSEKYLSARGVLLATFIYGGVVMYLKYFL